VKNMAFLTALLALVAPAPAQLPPEHFEEPWRPPLLRAESERRTERARMIASFDEHETREDLRISRPVREAMLAVPRHAFVPDHLQDSAYFDHPLPIGLGQTISQPYIVALMTELLQVDPDDKVLEIGTGSGYQAAVLGQLTPHVYTIEIVEELCARAQKTLTHQRATGIRVRCGDGYQGWEEEAPFNAILVTCGAEELPDPLWEQLLPGGRIVMPIGETHGIQRLMVIDKDYEGKQSSKSVLSVRFVPMTRDDQED
jgi:protein-L-isoaspartate(D-aspartate) O-methyltransferase